MNKFEQLIEYVINNEEEKARALFHEVVVEKSRAIYEEMMNDELGGDEVDDLMTDVETDEEGFDNESEADEFDSVGGNFGSDDEEDEFDSVEGDEFDIDSDSELDDDADDIEDRVVDIEDKLDELMAEFEALMNDTDDNDDDLSDDNDDATDDDTDDDSADADFDEEDDDQVNEAISLKAVPKATTSEEGNTNKRSVVAANSGAKGATAKPVTATGTDAKGRPAPTAKELVGRVGNTPAQSTQKPTPAKKPGSPSGTGVNTKSVIQ